MHMWLGVCSCVHVGVCVPTLSLGPRGPGEALRRREGKEQGNTMKGQEQKADRPEDGRRETTITTGLFLHAPQLQNPSRGHRCHHYSPRGATSSEVVPSTASQSPAGPPLPPWGQQPGVLWCHGVISGQTTKGCCSHTMNEPHGKAFQIRPVENPSKATLGSLPEATILTTIWPWLLGTHTLEGRTTSEEFSQFTSSVAGGIQTPSSLQASQ